MSKEKPPDETERSSMEFEKFLQNWVRVIEYGDTLSIPFQNNKDKHLLDLHFTTSVQ